MTSPGTPSFRATLHISALCTSVVTKHTRPWDPALGASRAWAK